MLKRILLSIGCLVLTTIGIYLFFLADASVHISKKAEQVSLLKIPDSPVRTGSINNPKYDGLQCSLDENGTLTCWITEDMIENWIIHGADAARAAVFISPTELSTNVADVAIGRSHLLFLTVEGTVWTFGENFDGQIGNGTIGAWNWVTKATLEPLDTTNNYALEPIQLSLPPCVAISTGNSVCAALTVKGEVYTWGDNSCGQIGNGERGNEFPTMSNLIMLEPYLVMTGINKISFNEDHECFVAFAPDQTVYTWGGDGPNTPAILVEKLGKQEE